MLANTFTFRYDSLYIPLNQHVTAHGFYANKYFGSHLKLYEDTAVIDPNHKTSAFKFARNPLVYGSTGYQLSIMNESYIGFFDKQSVYHIYSIKQDSMLLCHTAYMEDPNTAPQDYTELYCYTFYHVPTIITDLNQDQPLLPDIQVYPNPANQSIFFTPETASVSIFDGTGKDMYTGKAQQMNVQDWPKGIYLLKLVDNSGKSVNKKLLKE